MLLLLFCLLRVGDLRTQAVRLSLSECIAISTDSSLQAFRAKNMYYSSYWSYRAYKASCLPSISLQFNPMQYNRNITKRYDYSENLDIYREQQSYSSSGGLSVSQIIPLTGGTFSFDTDLSYLKNFGENIFSQYSSVPFRISYSQSVFGFNPYQWERKVEPLKYEQAKKKLVYQIEELSETTVTYFFDLVLAQKQYELAEEILLSTDTLYRVGQEREKISAILPSEIELLEIDLLNSENRLQTAAMNLRNAQYRLRSFLNRGEREEIEIDVPMRRPQIFISVEEALLQAQENNPDYLGFAQELLEAEKSLKQIEKESSFSASISASIGFNQASETLRGAYSSPSQQDVVSISVSIPMVDWGVRKGRMNMARNNLNITRLTIEQARENLKEEIISTIDRFHIHQELTVSAARALELATSAFENTKRRFIVGKSDVNSLTQNMNRRHEAQRNFIDVLKNYWMNYYKIRKLTLYDFEKNEKLSFSIDDRLIK
ncbi:MAG: TolC family protein [Dysgonamonadaceae bacterium]|nr:TolC family protein [Dysgonamonadaceae bacterium]